MSSSKVKNSDCLWICNGLVRKGAVRTASLEGLMQEDRVPLLEDAPVIYATLHMHMNEAQIDKRFDYLFLSVASRSGIKLEQ